MVPDQNHQHLMDANDINTLYRIGNSLLSDSKGFSSLRAGPVCSIIHDHQTAARMFTPVTANSKPRENFRWEFTLGQGGAAWSEAAPPQAGFVTQEPFPDHPFLFPTFTQATQIGSTRTFFSGDRVQLHSSGSLKITI